MSESIYTGPTQQLQKVENISFDVDPPDPKNINWDRLKKRLAREARELKIVWRDEWGAAEPLERVPLKVPVKNVVLLYTETDPCKTDDSCLQRVKAIQTDHMAKGLPDLPWNFMVGGNGKVYEGRGFNIEGADETGQFERFNKDSFDIAFMVGGNGKVYEGRGFNIEGADKTGQFERFNKDSFDIAYIAKKRDEVTKKMKFIKGQLIRFALLEWFVQSPFDFAEDKYDWEVMAAEKKLKDENAEKVWKKYHPSSSSSTEVSSFWSDTDEDGISPKPQVKKRRRRKKKKKSSSESEYPLGIPVKVIGGNGEWEKNDSEFDPEKL